ncbi:hypothetical protein BGZ60DRAFT_248025 [Tricladium varicosporioides]|nr:hypothetical protein BGZ60DRAFT_248025 [Hymenoscyphus varicosporioides]
MGPLPTQNVLSKPAQSQKNALTKLSPSLYYPLYYATTLLPRLLTSTTLFLTFRLALLSYHLLWHSYYASTILLIQTYYASYYLALHSYYVSCFLALHSYYASCYLALQSYHASAVVAKRLCVAGKFGGKIAWKRSEHLRNKLWFEFVVFALGGGNGMLLLVFWPGWLVIGPVVWVVYG